MGSMKASPRSEPVSAGSGSASTQGKEKRLSTTGKFLHNIFSRLKSPFSPPSTTPPLAATTSPSQQEKPPTPPTQTRPYSPENLDMAAAPARHGITGGKESVTTSSLPVNGMSGFAHVDKENKPAVVEDHVTVTAVARFGLTDGPVRPRSSTSIARETCTAGERAIHQGFMDQALDMARLALRTNETPVGCVLVHSGAVVARGMNATNVTRNGTRHAEFMALSALLSYRPDNIAEAANAQIGQQTNAVDKDESQDDDSDLFPMDDDYVSMGHLYPYGQKLHRASRVDRSIVRDCILYVTVEPCVMCAGLLRQLGIKKVYFGAVNDKFGGTGGVFSIHKNSTDVHRNASSSLETKILQPSANGSSLPRPSSSSSGKGSVAGSRQSLSSGGGDGGNIEPGFEAEGGWGRDEAVSLLRRFYVQENGRAPVPRKKEGRAARLAAMEAGSEAATPVEPTSSDAEPGNKACNTLTVGEALKD
ncbi:tRNA-specific adenosine deaminase subunit TAD2 [Colletotrichum plurivorum]|uniref:tRNA-specific adenosine deaminase subunit TAD2 n=1 Tax=Colletotrichum plurivorum TaxID=2175906 RepID=A0A8H6U5I7_9PEZI|nr:tRNA-specific adenosine deaminase subunit TAD2 [Colletotrichum plurivorum]